MNTVQSDDSAAPLMRKRTGFTLLEVLVTAAVSVILGSVLLVVLLSSSNAMATINGQGTLQMQLALGLQAFTQDVRYVTGLPLISASGNFPQDLTSAEDGVAMLILRVPSIDGNGQVIPSSSDDIIYDFMAETGVLRRVVEPGPGSSRTAEDHVVARDIAQVVFSIMPDGAAPPARGGITLSALGRRTEGPWTFLFPLSATSSWRN